MAVCKIMIYPQNKNELRRKSEPVVKIDRRVKGLIHDLKDTLQSSSDGIGLAAPQINRHLRVMVVYLEACSTGDGRRKPPIAMINPTIIESSDERKDSDGCLSFPGLYGDTSRPHRLRVTGLDEDRKFFDRVYEGFDAVLVHHELDHLDGVLFVDCVENLQDLYTVRENEHGEMVRVPVTLE